MNRESIGLSFVLTILFISQVAVSEAEGDRSVVELSKNPSIVFGYGVQLQPPFVFTGIGSDTLLMNGLPYVPMRSHKEHRTGEIDPPESQPEGPDCHSVLIRVRNDVWREVSDISDQDEALERYVEGLEARQEVEWAQREGDGVRLKLRSCPRPINVWYPLAGPVSDELRTVDPERLHRSRISGFKKLIDEGVFYAFGHGYVLIQGYEAAADLIMLGVEGVSRLEYPSEEGGKRFAADVAAARAGKASEPVENGNR